MKIATEAGKVLNTNKLIDLPTEPEGGTNLLSIIAPMLQQLSLVSAKCKQQM